MRNSPKPLRTAAPLSEVPDVLWRSAEARQLLAEICRRYGLPQRLRAERGGVAEWQEDDLNDVARIYVRDCARGCLEYKAVCERKLAFADLTRPLQKLWHFSGVRVDVNEFEDALLARGDSDAETLAALTLTACVAEGLLSNEIVQREQLFDAWVVAAQAWDGHERLRQLLRFALEPSTEPKTYQRFLEYLA